MAASATMKSCLARAQKFFGVRRTERILVHSDSVISLSDALKAAHEFSISTTMPK